MSKNLTKYAAIAEGLEEVVAARMDDGLANDRDAEMFGEWDLYGDGSPVYAENPYAWDDLTALAYQVDYDGEADAAEAFVPLAAHRLMDEREHDAYMDELDAEEGYESFDGEWLIGDVEDVFPDGGWTVEGPAAPRHWLAGPSPESKTARGEWTIYSLARAWDVETSVMLDVIADPHFGKQTAVQSIHARVPFGVILEQARGERFMESLTNLTRDRAITSYLLAHDGKYARQAR